ncbi:hypothetical protein KC19_2G114000 [Ceratodon purpureus]|uniref:Thaumatin-like protein n=1 Tax=Ceratodon purpureus TaxID=3225 RepID=A0A8T0IVN9_CERPU|nr:hypothetical protein KC19_2G114000 [Ceratodon purpureus]
MANVQLAAVVLSLLAITSCVCATKINVRNQCSFAVTACDQGQGSGVTCYALQNGGQQQKDVGASWPGGLFWGFPSGSGDAGQGNAAKPQANLAEFTIGSNGQDYYDLSNVNAYNLPLMINPTNTNGDTISGSHCGTLSCTINNLNSFCQAPNRLTGTPGNGCYNVDGPGNNPTAGTQAFKNACPSSYAYSKDDTGNPPVVYACKAGSDYEVVFCP